MRKLVLAAAMALGLFAGSAQAATVDIYANEVSPGDWDLFYASTITLSQINLSIEGATGFTIDPAVQPLEIDPGFSTIADFASGFCEPGGPLDPPGDCLTLGLSTGIDVTPLAASLVQRKLGDIIGLVSLVGPGLFDDIAFGGITAADPQGNPVSTSLNVIPLAPEPASAVLIGLGLAGLAFVRRRV